MTNNNPFSAIKATPATLPLTGKSRFSNFQPYCPFSKEKFRQLSRDGKAPKPERMGIRCTYYDNRELHRFLADPANYRVDSQDTGAGEVQP